MTARHTSFAVMVVFVLALSCIQTGQAQARTHFVFGLGTNFLVSPGCSYGGLSGSHYSFGAPIIAYTYYPYLTPYVAGPVYVYNRYNQDWRYPPRHYRHDRPYRNHYYNRRTHRGDQRYYNPPPPPPPRRYPPPRQYYNERGWPPPYHHQYRNHRYYRNDRYHQNYRYSR